MRNRCGIMLLIFTMGACARDGFSPTTPVDGGTVDQFPVSMPDLVKNEPLDMAPVNACRMEAWNLNSFGATGVVLLANADWYAVGQNGNKPGVLFLDVPGGGLGGAERFDFPQTLSDCPVKGKTCQGPFFFEPSGAVEPGGFIFDVKTEYYADLAIKLEIPQQGMPLSMVRLSSGNDNGSTWRLGYGVLTSDGAFAMTSAGPVPYAEVWARTMQAWGPINGMPLYGFVNNIPQDNFWQSNALSVAHAGPLVAFGGNGKNGPLAVFADTVKKTYVEAKLVSDPIYAVRRVRRVFATQDGFVFLEQDAKDANDFGSIFEMAFFKSDGSPGLTHVVTETDFAHVPNGFMGVEYDLQQMEIRFNIHDEQFVSSGRKATLKLSDYKFPKDLVPTTLPLIACVDQNHCAAIWQSVGSGAMTATMTCQ